MLNKFSAFIFTFILLFALVPGCAAKGSSTEYGSRVGNMAPDFTLNDINGNHVSLSALLGRPVVVHFWSTT